MSTASWFDVDKKGLAKLLAGRSKAFILFELLQNAWDQQVTKVAVWIKRVGRDVEIIVEDDDPNGFMDLAHAYTLFAESHKKADATKRGRFNLGEKLVLALAKQARIVTTKGTVEFADGRQESRARRKQGSVITVLIQMTNAEYDELLEAAQRVICPARIHTTINGDVLLSRRAVVEFEETLPTVIAQADGNLVKSNRLTTVKVYHPVEASGWLFEMGIPVVETGDRFDVDVQQKVPLNMDRDNVTPAYLRAIRVATLNATHSLLEEDDAGQTWVREACRDRRVADEAVRDVFSLRFGKDAVAFDPSDKEANKLAVAAGLPVVHGGNLTKPEWDNARRAGALPPAGTVTPSPKPFHPDGSPLTLLSEANWTENIQLVVVYAKRMAAELLDCGISVDIANDSGWKFAATYGKRHLILNLGRLGHKFFDQPTIANVSLNDLLIHEFAHHYESDHLSRNYYKALSSLGARLTDLAIRRPQLFTVRV